MLGAIPKDTPDRNKIYPGTRGNTQGERKERTPAINATPIGIWFITLPFG